MRKILITGGALLAGALSTAACGSATETSSTGPDRPVVAVTTDILGQVVDDAFGDLLDVRVVIPSGADPHEFAPSARQAEAIATADVVLSVGDGFEEGLASILDRARTDGIPVVAVAEAVDDDPDPHVWLDPTLVAEGLRAFASVLTAETALTAAQIDPPLETVAAELMQLDSDVRDTLAPLPRERRRLVTNHDAFSYFGARYDIEIVGTIIPSTSTGAEASAADLDRLADLIRELDIPAIFTETTESGRLPEALAESVGRPVAVVELYGGSLGPPGSGADTYAGFMRTNAARIVDALSAAGGA